MVGAPVSEILFAGHLGLYRCESLVVSVWYVRLWNWRWQIWIVFYVEGCGVSSAEYSVHLVGVNRLSACREFCDVHIWQNGTWCRDDLCFHSHLVWLVFEGSIPTYTCFHFVWHVPAVFLYCSLGEKRCGRVGRGEDAWCVQYDSIECICSQRSKNHNKLKHFQVKL